MNIIVLYSCLSVFSHCRYTLRLLLYICDTVQLHVAFFFSVLPFMVNKDEYIITICLFRACPCSFPRRLYRVGRRRLADVLVMESPKQSNDVYRRR